MTTVFFLQNRISDPIFNLVGEPRPVDGGFGTNPKGNIITMEEQLGFINENFGDRMFNTISLVEMAETSPFFCDNVIDNLVWKTLSASLTRRNF